jgi:hypothetical protein
MANRYNLPMEEESDVPEFQPEPVFPVETREPARESTRESRFEERRNRGRRDRTPSEPPEVIHVEMTPDEQDVYAWMGISPLILYPLTPKNPRSTVIKVHVPGEAPIVEETVSEEPQSLPVDEFSAIEAEFASVTSEFDESQEYGQRRQRTRVERRSDGSIAPPVKRSLDQYAGFESQESQQDVSFEVNQGYSLGVSVDTEPNDTSERSAPQIEDSTPDSNEDENGVPRRRRRRSSAV